MPANVHPSVMNTVTCRKTLSGSALAPIGFAAFQLHATPYWQEVRITRDQPRVPAVLAPNGLLVYHTALSHAGCFFKCLSFPGIETKRHEQATVQAQRLDIAAMSGAGAFCGFPACLI